MIASGVAVGLAARVLGLSEGATDALAGAALGLLAGFGAPYAFGVGRAVADSALGRAGGKIVNEVVPDESAVRAEYGDTAPSAAESDLLVCLPDGLDEDEFTADGPRGDVARGTTAPGSHGLKLRAQLIDIGHI